MELRVVTVVVMAIVTMTTLLALVHETEGRPSSISDNEDGWVGYMNRFHSGSHLPVNACDNSSEVRELCQRCAKATKSRWAYPLCCEEREDTRRFCRNFINFGISPNNAINT